jgi:hypothetical protein
LFQANGHLKWTLNRNSFGWKCTDVISYMISQVDQMFVYKYCLEFDF